MVETRRVGQPLLCDGGCEATTRAVHGAQEREVEAVGFRSRDVHRGRAANVTLLEARRLYRQLLGNARTGLACVSASCVDG